MESTKKEINIVTCFNETILKDTAVHLLNSTKENLDTSINFTAYYHDCKIDAYSLPDYTYKSLHDIKDHEDFLKRYAEHDGTEEGKIPYN